MDPRKAGFTLIELLIVVVIIGILAAIAIPKFATTKEKAFLATMKSDLRNFATAQEGYFYSNAQYYSGPVPAAAIAFSPSGAVTVTVVSADGMGWSATASHSGTSKTCAIFFGNATPLGGATGEGEPACN